MSVRIFSIAGLTLVFALCGVPTIAVATTDRPLLWDSFGEFEQLMPLLRPEQRFEPVLAALRRGDTGEAKRALEPVLAETPEHPGALELDGMVKLAEGDFAGAEASLRRSLSLYPDNPSAATKLAIARLGQNDVAEAKKLLAEALSVDPHNLVAHILRARIAWRERDLETAAQHYEASVAAAPDEGSRLRTEVAGFYASTGQYEKLIEVAEPLAKSDAATPQGLYHLARAYSLTGRTSEGLETARTIVRRFPRYAPGHLLYAAVLNQVGQFEEAKKVAREATKTFPETVEAWITYGGLLLSRGEFKAAEKAFLRGLELHPQNAALQFQLGTIYQSTGREKQAEYTYREILELNPNQTATLNNLAMLLSEEPEKQHEALELARRAHRLAPQSPAVEDTLGWLLYLNGNHEEAVQVLRSAREKAPEDPNVTCRLGMAYAAQKDRKARGMLEECLKADIDSSLRTHVRSVLDTL